MSWRERDYSQASWGERVVFGVRVPPPGVIALLIAHAVAFVALFAARRDIGPEAAAFGALSGKSLHWSAVLLHPFAVPDILTLLILGFSILWMLGGRLEARMGIGPVLFLYIAGNLLAGAAYFVVARIQPDLAQTALAFPVGASAAWIVAAWRELGDEELSFFGLTLPAGKMYVYFGLGLVAVMLLLERLGAVAWVAAVGGGCIAPLLRDVPRVFIRSIWGPRRGVVRPSVRLPALRGAPDLEMMRADDAPAGESTEVDAILAKISTSGIASLTPAEREQLEAARRALLKRS